MGQARGEVTTNLVDLTGLSLDELRRSDDPVLLESLVLVADRADGNHPGVLQNQNPDGR
jgi:hypothetical protein